MKNRLWLSIGGLIVLPLVTIQVLGAEVAAQSHARITMEKAKRIALRQVAGSIQSSEFEHEKGQDVYSFDIRGRDKQIHEILVSANSGKIVSNTVESAAKETAEQRADQSSKTQ